MRSRSTLPRRRTRAATEQAGTEAEAEAEAEAGAVNKLPDVNNGADRWGYGDALGDRELWRSGRAGSDSALPQEH